MHYDQQTVKTITPASTWTGTRTRPGQAQPSMSSWGYKGYSEVWLNEGNDWIYRHLHERRRPHGRAGAASAAATALAGARSTRRRASCCWRRSSDWAFIMKTGTMVEYAEGRTRDHLARFHFLADAVERGRSTSSGWRRWRRWTTSSRISTSASTRSKRRAEGVRRSWRQAAAVAACSRRCPVACL